MTTRIVDAFIGSKVHAAQIETPRRLYGTTLCGQAALLNPSQPFTPEDMGTLACRTCVRVLNLKTVKEA